MLVDAGKCTGCGLCPPYCPMEAISVGQVASIDQDECVECGVCRRSRVCPVEAFYQPEMGWPRRLRAIYSDQSYRPEGAPPRSSEGMKIGEVTGHYQRGQAQLVVELGRPGVGARFRDLQKFIQAMAAEGYRFTGGRAIGQVLAEPAAGIVKPEVLNEKASRIPVSYTVPLDRVPAAWAAIQRSAAGLDTVASVGLVQRAADSWRPAQAGMPAYANGKTNVGLGRPRAEV